MVFSRWNLVLYGKGNIIVTTYQWANTKGLFYVSTLTTIHKLSLINVHVDKYFTLNSTITYNQQQKKETKKKIMVVQVRRTKIVLKMRLMCK